VGHADWKPNAAVGFQRDIRRAARSFANPPNNGALPSRWNVMVEPAPHTSSVCLKKLALCFGCCLLWVVTEFNVTRTFTRPLQLVAAVPHYPQRAIKE
jgi:hypothetical protein